MTHFITLNRGKTFPHLSNHTHVMFESHIKRTSAQNHIQCINNMLLPKLFSKNLFTSVKCQFLTGL